MSAPIRLSPPSTPTCCADTATYANPARTIPRCAMNQTAGASMPPLTLSHSTITVPVKSASSAGRHTTMRVT
jgi:hypothetical protein